MYASSVLSRTLRAVRPAGLDELAATDRLARARDELREQPELGRRERDLLAVDERGVRERVEAHAGALDRVGLPGAAEQRVQPRDELGERKGLRDVVVAARAESRDAIRQRVARREEEHGRLHALRAQRLADVAAVGIGQTDVDDQDVRRLRLDALEQLGPGADTCRVEALLAQAAQKHAAESDVVLDDQNLRHRGG